LEQFPLNAFSGRRMAQFLLKVVVPYKNKRTFGAASMTLSRITVLSDLKNRPIAKAIVHLILVLSAILYLGIFGNAEAAIINANSVSLIDVQTAVNSANPGDTVNVPAGTSTWMSNLTINTDIQFIGAGIGQTVIIDGGSTALNPMISWTTSSNYFDRLSGFTFQGNNNALSYQGTIQVHGTCHAFRLDDCEFNLLDNCNVAIDGWMYGCVDHCIFYRNNVFGVQVHEDNWGGGNNYWGDGSWAAPDYLGTTNSIYIEDNIFTNSCSSPGAFDMEDGGRIVFRYNMLTNDSIGFHGTETSQRERSGREFEVYGNSFIFLTNSDSSWFCGFFIRGGTGVIFSNYFYNYKALADLAAYRLTPNGGPWIPWGNADGLDGWDSNGPGVYASGAAAATTENSLTDSTKNWAINQWVTNNGTFVLQDVNQNEADWIYSNNATTVFFLSGDHLGGAFTINSGDTYKIGFVSSVLDQPGRGQGDLLADTSVNPVPNGIPYDKVTGGTNWPNEASDPIYEWGNSFVMPIQNPLTPYIVTSEPTMVTNRDYIDGVPKPGYTPLPFPHPLDTTNVLGSSPTFFTLTVVNGASTGGSYTNGAIVSISANAPSTGANAAFAFWNGPDIANTNQANTTVTMPGSNITVTAEYIPMPLTGLTTNPASQ
jgi:hypothetical protein